MANILALDTSTEYCSVALQRDGTVQHLCEQVPRRHNQRVFSMLEEIMDGGDLVAQGIDALAWNCGPGSFTGLRIAASAIQGLAFAHDLPVASVSTLACVVQGLYRREELSEGEIALVLLDARINEIYWGLYRIEQGLAVALQDDAVCKPDELPLQDLQEREIKLVCGDGLVQAGALLQEAGWSVQQQPGAAPAALDTLPLAGALVDRDALLVAEQVEPVYLRNEIGWKKLAEQGPQA